MNEQDKAVAGDEGDAACMVGVRLQNLVLQELSSRLADSLFDVVATRKEAEGDDERGPCSACQGSCKGGCKNACKPTCTGCKGSCKTTCEGDCSGTCKDSCDNGAKVRMADNATAEGLVAVTEPAVRAIRQVLSYHGYPG